MKSLLLKSEFFERILWFFFLDERKSKKIVLNFSQHCCQEPSFQIVKVLIVRNRDLGETGIPKFQQNLSLENRRNFW